MSIVILYVDLRRGNSTLQKFEVEWDDRITVKSALEKALGLELTARIADDLQANSQQIILSWHNTVTNEHSEIGGIGSLDWKVSNNSIFTIVYEDENTTEEQINKSSEWMSLNNGG